MIQKTDYCIEFEQELTRCAKQVGLDDKTIEILTNKLTDSLFKRWSGLTIYFKKSVFCDLDTRNQKIITDYNNGLTLKQLSQKFNLSTQGIYGILKKSEAALLLSNAR